jgi:hypothetical protein
MMILRALVVFCARALAVAGVAVATMMLGWIITARAASLVPDDADRGNATLCERTRDMICQPDVPGLMTRPATLITPDLDSTVRTRGASVTARALTNF